MHSFRLSGRRRDGGFPAIIASVCLFALAGQGIAGTVRPAACPAPVCQASLVVPASMFGDDERRTERQFAEERNTTLRDIQNRYAASGAITCRGFGRGRNRRSIVYASGQLTGRNDIITTTAHTIIGKNARPLGDLSRCVFETTIDGRKARSRLTRAYVSGFSDPDDANFAGFDWAVIRLRDPLPVEPYPVVGDLDQMFRLFDVANVTKVANFNFDNWGAKRTRVKSLAECVIKPEIVAWSSGVRGIRTGCDISPGNSGGAVLSEMSGKPVLIGIMVGTTSASFKRRKKFDLYNDYNIGALVEGEFLQAINDMASAPGVDDVQKALDELGYDPGPADGIAGKRTRRAITAFQKDKGLKQTGTMTAELTKALQAATSGRDQDDGTAADPAHFVADLYEWRRASAGRAKATRPDWLSSDAEKSLEFGPQSAWTSPDLSGCRNILACLEESGAPGTALRAAYLLEKTGLVGAYVSRFDEFGPVDLVTIGLAYASGEQSEYALVNSPGGAISLRSSKVRKSNQGFNQFVRLKAEYPQARLHMTPRFESFRQLDKGRQRFVFAYPVTNGCVACQPVAQVLFAFDFRADGRPQRQLPLAASELETGQGWYAPRNVISGQLMIDTQAVQLRLNELGYAAGPIDGVAGRKTELALREFQVDHGLAVTSEIDAATASILAGRRIDRHLRRFETLLADDNDSTVAFGSGLLSRMPGNEREQRAALANNIAGRLMLDGKPEAALAMLRRAEEDAAALREDRPLLYAALLLNLATVSVAIDDANEAERLAGDAATLVEHHVAVSQRPGAGRKATAEGSIDGKIVTIAEMLMERAAGDRVRLSFERDDKGRQHIFTLLYPASGSEPI